MFRFIKQCSFHNRGHIIYLILLVSILSCAISIYILIKGNSSTNHLKHEYEKKLSLYLLYEFTV